MELSRCVQNIRVRSVHLDQVRRVVGRKRGRSSQTIFVDCCSSCGCAACALPSVSLCPVRCGVSRAVESSSGHRSARIQVGCDRGLLTRIALCSSVFHSAPLRSSARLLPTLHARFWSPPDTHHEDRAIVPGLQQGGSTLRSLHSRERRNEPQQGRLQGSIRQIETVCD